MHGSYVESCTAHIQAQSRHTHKHGQTAETWLQNLHGFWIACDAAIKPLFCYTHKHMHMHTLTLIHTSIRIQSCRMNAAAAAIFVLDAKAVSIWVLSAFVYIHTTHFTLHILASFFQIFHTAYVHRTANAHIHICQNHFHSVFAKFGEQWNLISFHFISKKSPVKESDSIERDSGEHIA